MAMQGPMRQRQAGGVARMAVALALPVMLFAACSSNPPEPDGYSPAPKFSPRVSHQPAMLMVALPGPAGEFTPEDRRRLATFMDSFRNIGRGVMVVTVAAADSRQRAMAGRAVLDLARKHDVMGDGLQVREVVTGQPGIRAAYETYSVTMPECQREIALARTPDNSVSENFGCALERSLAVMAVNPADLEGAGAPVGSSDGSRQAWVVGQYRQGKATQGEVERNEDAKISKVGGGK